MLTEDFRLLRRALLRQGLSGHRADRLTGELEGHAWDIRDELLAAGCPEEDTPGLIRTRLGDFGVLAEEMRRTLASRSLTGRHPGLFCLTAPFIGLALLPLPLILAVKLISRMLGGPDVPGLVFDLPALLAWGLTGFYVYQHLYIGLLSVGLLLAARRHAISLKWTTVAVALLALGGGLLTVSLSLTPTGLPGKMVNGSLSLGLGIQSVIAPEQIWRIIAPLGLFLAFYWRNFREGWLRA